MTAAAYTRELAQVKALGFALDRNEESDTYACAAAPVFDRRGSPVAALWISGPVDRVTPDLLPKLAAIVRKHAMQLSERLGYQAVH